MAQTNFTPILTYKSDTATSVPSAGNLTNSTNGAELAVNTADKRLFTKDSGGNVVEVGTNPSSLTLPNSTANGVFYSNGSKVVTSGSALTFDGTRFNVNTSATNGILNIGANGASQNALGFIDTQASGKTWVTGPSIATGSVSDFTLYNVTSAALASVYTDGASGKWAWYANGSEQMRLTSTGLGIGTSSPATKLHVSGQTRIADSSSASNYILIGSGANAPRGGNSVMAQTGSMVMGTEAASNLLFITNATEAARLDSSGNLGLGVTPSAWQVNNRAIQLFEGYASISSNNSQGCADVGMNCYNTSAGATSGWKYTNSFSASLYQQHAGLHKWLIAPSGTAGNAITFTQAMTLDASSNLYVGLTPVGSTAKLIVKPSSTYGMWVTNGFVDGTPYGLEFGFEPAHGSYRSAIRGAPSSYGGSDAGILTFYTSSSYNAGAIPERMRIDSSGNVGIGTSSPAAKLDVVNGSIRVNEDGIGTKILTLRSDYAGLGPAINVTTTDPLLFLTANTERMRIDSSGNLRIGTTSSLIASNRRMTVSGQAGIEAVATGTTSEPCIEMWQQATSGNNRFSVFYTEGSPTERGSITYNRAGGLTAYNTTSDYRAKDIIGPVQDSGSVIDSVPVYMGLMKGATQERPMFIAHETPTYAHTGEKDAVDKDGNPVYQQMDASALIPVMWAEIQSLRKRLADAGIA